MWKDESARPEFWPESLNWVHPFSSSLTNSQILTFFVSLVSKCGPSTIKALPKDETEQLGYEEIHEPSIPIDNNESQNCEIIPFDRDALIAEIKSHSGSHSGDEAAMNKCPYYVKEKIVVKKALCTTKKPGKLKKLTSPKPAVDDAFDVTFDDADAADDDDYRPMPKKRKRKTKQRNISKSELDAEYDLHCDNYDEPCPNSAKYGTWLELPSPVDKLGNYVTQDYLACLVKCLMKDDDPQYSNPECRPSFWPKWAPWMAIGRIGVPDARKIIREIMKHFGVEESSVPINPYEYESRRASTNFSPRLKKYLGIPTGVNLVKDFMLKYPTLANLLCFIPRLRQPIDQSPCIELRFFLSSLYSHLVSLLGENVMLPFQDGMRLAAKTDSWPGHVKKYIQLFGLQPKFSNSLKTLIGYSYLRLKRFAQRMGHMVPLTKPKGAVSSCNNWPIASKPLNDMSNDEMATYLTRVIIFLNKDIRIPIWDMHNRVEAWPNWAEWRDPHGNDEDLNRRIIDHILQCRGVSKDEIGNPKMIFWPSLPKPLEEMDFTDVIGYIVVLTYHLEAYKPDLSKPDHRPNFWQGDWGLPEKFDATIDPQSIANWVERQKLALRYVIEKHGPKEGVTVDVDEYMPHYFRCFPYLGRFGEIDRLAEARLTNAIPNNNDGKKIPLTHWPKIDISKRYISEMSFRGFLVELVLLISGRFVRWDSPDHRPEYWPLDVTWHHPFTAAFCFPDVLKTIVHCVKIFGPDFIGFSHEHDYTTVMEEPFHELRDELKDKVVNVAISRQEFVRQCEMRSKELTAAMTTTATSLSTTSKTDVNKFSFDKIVCRLCGSVRAGAQSLMCEILDHLKEAHGQEVICEICSKTFTSQSRLKRHRDMIHLRLKEKACKICGKVINDNMSKHMLMHGPKTLQCPHCPKMFRHKSNLKIHLPYHLAVRPFSCEVCDQKFARKANWKRHLLQHKNGIEIK